MNPPAFQFYPDDFLAGTMHFTDAETGLYIRLLCVQWSKGKLPCDKHMLSSYGKGDTDAERILEKFEAGKDGFLRNKRLEMERQKQKQYRKSRSDNGKRGGRPKSIREPYGKHMVLKTKAQESSPSPSPSPIKEEGNGAPLPPSVLIKEVFESWNQLGCVPKCLLVSDKIRRSLQVRLREPFFLENWKPAMQRVAASNFCQGQNERGWRASLDWFITPDVVRKIMEGKYDNRPAYQNPKPNPRNAGVIRGPTNYATAKPRLQRELEEKARLAGQVAVDAADAPASPSPA